MAAPLDPHILDALDESILVIDAAGRVEFANRAASLLFDRPEPELLGAELAWLIVGPWPPSGTTIRSRLATARGDRPGQAVEGRVSLLSDGRTLLSVRPIDGRGGSATPGFGAEGLLAAAARLGPRLDSRTVLNSAVERLVHDLGAVAARAWLLPAEPGSAASAVAGAMLESADGSPAGPGNVALAMLVDEVARARRPIVRHAAEHRQDFDPRWIAAAGIVGLAAAPLFAGDAVRGVLAAFSRERIDPAAGNALAAFGGIVSAALDDACAAEALAAERAVSESARRTLQAVLDALPVGVMLIDPNGLRPSVVNPAAEDLGAPDLLRRLADERALAQAMRGGERVDWRLRFRGDDGRHEVIDISIAPFPGPEGGAVAAFRDVTEQYRTEGEAAERSAQLKALLDHLPVGVAYFDDRGVCRAANTPARRTLGRSRGDVAGLRADELFDRAPTLRDALHACLRDRVHQTDLAVAWDDPAGGDDPRYIDWRFEPLTTDPDKPSGVLALIIDETERKRAEVQLERARDEAERASRNKTQSLRR